MRSFKLVCLVASLTFAACLPTNGSFAGYAITRVESAPASQPAQPVASGVYINNYRLSAQEEVLMAAILKEERIPAGRYYITQDGMMGLEGQPPYGNIIPYIQEYKQRHARGGNGGRARGGDVAVNSRGGVGDGTLAISGGCAIASIPGMSISSGC